MKTTKIDFRAKSVSWIIVPVVIISLFFSCDVLEPDADLLKPAVTIDARPVFVLSNNSVFIDLNSRVTTNQPARISVTSATKFGALSDLGKGLLQYTPSVGKRAMVDSFEFTIFSERNQVYDVDTVVIRIENDSTNLPCGIFPVDDYVYGATANNPVSSSVLVNDYICAADPADLIVSIYRPDDTYPPHFGTAEVSGKTVVYTPGSGFELADRVIYKVYHPGNPESAAFGALYIAGEQPCEFFLRSDSVAFDLDSLIAGVRIPVLQNDSLCASGSYQSNVTVPAKYGTAMISDHMIAYQLDGVQTIAPFESDFFLYEICIDATCATARVDIRVLSEDAESCAFSAVGDTMDLSGNAIPSMYLDILSNDTICEGYSTFTITESPNYGTASFDATLEAILYQRDPLVNRNDSLEYEICSGGICSRAKVYITRE